MTLTNDYLKGKSKITPTSKTLPQTPQTVAVVKNITTNISRLESKNYGEKYNAKDREVAWTKAQFAPCYRYRYTHHKGEAR